MSNYLEMSHDELVVRAIKKAMDLDKDQLIAFISTRSFKNQNVDSAIMTKILIGKIKSIVQENGSYHGSKILGVSEDTISWIQKNGKLPYNAKPHLLFRNIERHEINKGVEV